MASIQQIQRPRMSGKSSDFVTIIVGPDPPDNNTDDTQDPSQPRHPNHQQESFLLHTGILTHHSAFFRAAFNSSFSEAQTRTLSLPTETVPVFEIFTHWLYYQRLPSAQAFDPPEIVIAWTNATQGSNGRGLLDLYIFADKYQVAGLKAIVLEEYFKMVLEKQEPGLAGVEMVGVAFEMLPKGDAFRRLLIDARCFWDSAENYGGGEKRDGGEGKEVTMAASASANTKKDDELDWPVEFLAGVMRKYAELREFQMATPGSGVCKVEREQSFKFGLDLCDYHDHRGSEERTVCKRKRGCWEVDDGAKKKVVKKKTK
ncbi:hypothetical protein DM02DRAFT_661548 [Periconia macrospinosa]|uniref:BTB domain-containing protein n=1 Tax=Periconia macrospinosa TaxID=97972 RepID=A0A2V1D8L6_9PLEO|nr:hypothetical protein DM02DRAFT_661548 [Periconia macrospinosa]